MLGGEQSGHIEAIGFEMYTTMLEEAVSKLKGEGREERPQVTVNLGISLRIDDAYIPGRKPAAAHVQNASPGPKAIRSSRTCAPSSKTATAHRPKACFICWPLENCG